MNTSGDHIRNAFVEESLGKQEQNNDELPEMIQSQSRGRPDDVPDNFRHRHDQFYTQFVAAGSEQMTATISEIAESADRSVNSRSGRRHPRWGHRD